MAGPTAAGRYRDAVSVSTRVTAIASCAVAITLVAAACTPDGDVPPEHGQASASSAPVHLTVAVYGPAPVVKAYREIAASFHATHPKVTVKVDAYRDATAELAAVRTGATKSSEPDLFLAGIDDLPQVQADALTQPVDRLLGQRQVDFGDGYTRAALEAFSNNAALQCMPTEYSPLVVYYNTDLVDLQTAQGTGRPITAGRGWSMAQFTAAVDDALVGRRPAVYIDPSLEQVAPFVWSAGGQIVDDPSHPTALTFAKKNNPATMTKLLAVVADRRAHTRQPTSQSAAIKLFERGRLAMLFGYRDLTGELRANSKVEFDVLPMPSLGHRATSGQIAGMCLSRTTPTPSAAADFLAYLVGQKSMDVLAETGYVMPTSLAATSSNVFWQPDQRPASASVFTDQIRYVQQLPVTPTWADADALASKRLAELFASTTTDPDPDLITSALDALDDESTSVLVPPTTTPSPSESPSESPTATTSASPSD